VNDWKRCWNPDDVVSCSSYRASCAGEDLKVEWKTVPAVGIILTLLCSAEPAIAIALQSTSAAKSPKPTLAQLAEVKTANAHYLLLVNTAVARLLTPADIAEFDRSPYNGLAVAFWHAYDSSPAPAAADLEQSIADWKKLTKKDIWPWVYINRLIGVDETEINPYTKDPYFHRFQGADLDDKAGALSDFLQYWQNALRAAKTSGVPGIFCDLEYYNYHKEYDIGEMSRRTGKSPAELVSLLKGLGARMATKAATEYPDATLWFAFTGFGYPSFKTIDGQPYYPTPAYIAMGLLDEISAKHFQLKVISGGEGSLGYCHETLEQFRGVIVKRAGNFAPQLQKYGGALELGGTLTLWSDRSAKKGEMLEGACGNSTASTVEELEPYLELIAETYRYNFIYASGDGGYSAFKPEIARRFNAVIARAAAAASAQIAH
jgi:hypothetical protein